MLHRLHCISGHKCLSVIYGVVLFFLTRCPAPAQAGSPEYDIRRVGSQDGLFNQVITTACTDEQGLLWIGTVSGLYSFDGVRLSNAAASVPRLGNNWISDLELLPAGLKNALWVATHSGSYLLDTETRQIIAPSKAGLPDSVLRHCSQVEKYGDGSMVALAENRLYKLNPTSDGRFTARFWRQIPQEQKITRLFSDPQYPDEVWILPENAWLYHVSRENIRLVPIPEGERTPPSYEGLFQLRPGQEPGYSGWDYARNLYHTDRDGNIFLYPDKQMTLERLLPGIGAIDGMLKQKPIIRYYRRLENGQELFGTSLGLFIVRKKKMPFRVIEPMIGKEIRAILTDSQGNWWAGTYSGLHSGSLYRRQVENNPKLITVWAFLHLDGDNWLLGLETRRGLFFWNKKTGANKRLPAFSENHVLNDWGEVLSLCRDRCGNIWVGSFSGIFWSPPDTPLQFRRLTDAALNRPFHAPYVRALHVEPDSGIWAGAENGLFRIRHDPGSGGFVWDTILHGVFVSGFYADRHGYLWIATKGKGVARYGRKDGRFKWFDTETGLSNNLTCRIEGSHQDRVFWISTHDGLTRLDASTGITHIYSEEDGFPGNEFNTAASARFPDGSLLFGGVNGLIWFHPDSIDLTAYRHNTLVSGAQVYNKRSGYLRQIAIGPRGIQLAPYPDYVVFQLGSTEFVHAQKVGYRYRLHGIQDDWVYIRGEQAVRFIRLPPGDYVFEVQALPFEGHFGSPVKIPVHVATPWYERRWFIFFLLAAIIAVIYGAYNYRIHQVLREQAMRRQIADDLHDDIGNKLNILSILSQKIAEGIRKGDDQESSLRKLMEISRETLRSLHTMIWSVDPGKDRLSNLLARMQDFADDYLQPLNIQYVFDAPEVMPDREMNLKARHHVMLIYQELLTNMIKHTDPRKIIIRIRIAENANLTLSLNNTYRLPPAEPVITWSAQRGRDSVERRLQQVNGHIQDISAAAGGQSISLSFPNVFK